MRPILLALNHAKIVAVITLTAGLTCSAVGLGWWSARADQPAGSGTASKPASAMPAPAKDEMTFKDVGGSLAQIAFAAGDAAIRATVLTADSKALVEGGYKLPPRVRDLSTGVVLRRLEGADGVLKLQYSSDGKLLAGIIEPRGFLCVWNATTGKLLQRITLKQEDGYVNELIFPDPKTVGALFDRKTVLLWDVSTGKERLRQEMRDLHGHPSSLSPDGRFVATGIPLAGKKAGEAGRHPIRLQDVSSGKERLTLAGHQGPPAAFAFSRDGKLLASFDREYQTISGSGRAQPRQAPGDETVRVWDTTTGRELARMPRLPALGRANAMAFSPDGRSLAVRYSGVAGLFDQKTGTYAQPIGFMLWEVASGQERLRLVLGKEALYDADFRYGADGKALTFRVRLDQGDTTAAMIWDMSGVVREGRRQTVHLTAAEVDTLWADLASADAAKGFRAVQALSAAPREALPLFRERLRGDADMERRIARLIVDLDSDQFAVRARASSELEKIGRVTEPALWTALAGSPALETKKRLEQVLQSVAGKPRDPNHLRGLRAVEVLESIGTKEACDALQALAGEGEPRSMLAREARASLERLNQRAMP